jgi:hypothetical protein
MPSLFPFPFPIFPLEEERLQPGEPLVIPPQEKKGRQPEPVQVGTSAADPSIGFLIHPSLQSILPLVRNLS